MAGISTRSAVVIVVAGALCLASSAVLVKVSGSSPGTAAFYRCAFALPLLAGLRRFDRHRNPGRRMPARAAWIARGAGALFAANLVAWTYAIADLGAGLATVLSNLQVILVAVLAWWLLGERPTGTLLTALGVVLCGVALVAGLGSTASYGSHPVQGVLFGLLTSLLYACFLLVFRRGTSPGSDTGPVHPLYEATLGATLTAAVLALALRDLEWSWPALGWLALLALTSQVIGWLLITVSLPILPASLTSCLLLVQPAGALALGAATFGERPSVEQLAGVAVILAGVVMATRGSQPGPAGAVGGAGSAASPPSVTPATAANLPGPLDLSAGQFEH